MANTAYFIDEQYLKDNSPLGKNIDMVTLYPFMKTAEDIHIQQTLGTNLYNDLITKVIADPTLAGYPNELALCKLIRSCMVWLVALEALPFIGTKIANIGNVQQNGENLTNADQGKESRLEYKCKNNAMHYTKMLQGYLCTNQTLFSTYCCSNWDCSKLLPNQNVSNSCDLAFDRGLPSEQIVDIKFLKRYFG